MKAAMVTFEVKPGRVGDFVGKVGGLWTKIQGLPGIGPSYLVLEEGTGSCLNFGLWQTPEQATNFAENPDFLRFLADVRPLLSSEPVRKVFEVLATSSKDVNFKAA